MDLWDKPIPTSCLHNFPSCFEDTKCHFYENILLDDDESVSSIEYPNSDDDSYLSTNPISSRPVMHLTCVHAIPQVVVYISLAPLAQLVVN
jgi:hypothetical protein